MRAASDDRPARYDTAVVLDALADLVADRLAQRRADTTNAAPLAPVVNRDLELDERILSLLDDGRPRTRDEAALRRLGGIGARACRVGAALKRLERVGAVRRVEVRGGGPRASITYRKADPGLGRLGRIGLADVADDGKQP